MAIWFKPYTIEDLHQRARNTMSDFLGIKFIAIDENSISATMPASEKTRQPIGIIHGGANVVLAETLASNAANAVIDIEKQYCVGLEINANHLHSVREGLVTGRTFPIHLGRSTQVWQIEIRDESGKLSCISRMTAAVMSR